MRYTQSELRLVDAFALMLVGTGLLLGVLGCFDLATSGHTHRVVFRREAARGGRPGDGAGRVTVERVGTLALTPGWAWTVLGFVLVCLGAALNTGLRRVIVNGGDERKGGGPARAAPPAGNTADVHTAPATGSATAPAKGR